MAAKPSAGDVQRLFLQAVISRRVLTEKLARTLWQKCAMAVATANSTLNVSVQDNTEQWNHFLDKMNKSLDGIDLEFRGAVDEDTGLKMYALVNRKSDEVAQVATHYTANEIAYFKAIIEQIMLAPNNAFSLSSLAALREVSSLKTSMSKTQAEAVLESFVSNNWLVKSKKGRYSVSTRTMLELQPYFRHTYAEELLECTICMEIVTKGYSCNKANCHTYLHNHCYQRLARQRTTCPSCQQDWSSDDIDRIGEEAAREGHESRRAHKRRSTGTHDEQDDEVVDASQASIPSQSEAAPPTRPSQAKNGALKAGMGRMQRSAQASDQDEDGDLRGHEGDDAMDIDNFADSNNRRS